MTKLSRLTKKQERVFEILKNYIQTNNEAPTVQELMGVLDLSSPRSVTQYLEALENKGLILRSRYEPRGIRLVGEHEKEQSGEKLNIPVIASAGCDQMAILAERQFDEFICVPKTILKGKENKRVVGVKAIGDSMDEAGILSGDYVLVEVTDHIQENDLVVAIVDGFAVIKKIEYANNAIILKPVSSNPSYKPIILRRDYHIFGKVIDVIRSPQSGELEIVPLFQG